MFLTNLTIISDRLNVIFLAYLKCFGVLKIILRFYSINAFWNDMHRIIDVINYSINTIGIASEHIIRLTDLDYYNYITKYM